MRRPVQTIRLWLRGNTNVTDVLVMPMKLPSTLCYSSTVRLLHSIEVMATRALCDLTCGGARLWCACTTATATRLCRRRTRPSPFPSELGCLSLRLLPLPAPCPSLTPDRSHLELARRLLHLLPLLLQHLVHLALLGLVTLA